LIFNREFLNLNGIFLLYGPLLGGFHLGQPDEPESIRIIRTAIDNGINLMDNSKEFNSGKSEIPIDKASKDGLAVRARGANVAA
jgi:aryl-alcohol dehydrogenase-like predicted oxidoreductase